MKRAKAMRVAGIMSGTSLDGIDVAIADIGPTSVRTVAHACFPWPAKIRAEILAVSNSVCSTGAISRLNFALGSLYADAVRKTCARHRVALSSIELVGCHGQTIYHEGGGKTPNTFQIGEASVIAERLGVSVVSDFRTRDMAAGGQGAPLVPFADELLFRDAKKSRVSLNIGGIANITVLRPGKKTIAFDTGPGNMVIDQLVSIATHGKQSFDRGGKIAAQGRLNQRLLNQLLRARYFAAPPPKTAGREQYGLEFVEELIASGLSLTDLITTTTVFTGATIALAIQRFAPGTQEVVAAGGGVHNPRIMDQLRAFLPACRMTTTAEFGVDPDAKEAIAFALLAYRTWRRQTGNVPSATGARRAVPLGKVTFYD